MIVLANVRWLYVNRKARNLAKRAYRGDCDAVVVAWLQSTQVELIRVAVPDLDEHERQAG